MVRILYNFLILLYHPVLFFGGWFSRKILKMRVGQSQTLNLLNSWKLDRPIWVHAASLGEFEMALPLIEAIHKEQPETPILISFFSPSGYENANIPAYCKKVYLGADTVSHSRIFIETLNPQLAIFVKYEIWLNHLNACHQLHIPVFYWNLILRKDHFIFSSWGKPWFKTISKCKTLFCQNELTIQLLSDSKINQCVLTGDIRFNRALEIQQLNLTERLIKHSDGELIQWLKSGNILILGSSWPTEEKMLKEALTLLENNPFNNVVANSHKPNRVVIVPHDVSEGHIQQIQQLFSAYNIGRFSEKFQPETQILILDEIGQLSRLYRFARLAFIGGGFSGQLHNIIEPAAAGCITFYGPNATKFPEADQFEHWNIGFKISNESQLASRLNQFWVSTEETKISNTFVPSKEQIVEQIQLHSSNIDSCVKSILNGN